MPVIYLRGDATSPRGGDPMIIPHVVNTEGGWGKGFVLALSKKWDGPEAKYRAWSRYRELPSRMEHGKIVMTSGPFQLGEVQLVQVEEHLFVANMIAQFGYKTGSKVPPIRYEALAKCLGILRGYANQFKASIHMPRIGTGLAGGTWDKIEPLIQANLAGIPVTVYDLG